MVTGRSSRLVLAAGMLAALVAAAEPGKVSKETIPWRGKQRSYFLYAPKGGASSQKLPLVLCLHGSGRDGEPILDRFKDLAEKERFLLAGPNSTDSVHWTYPQDGPAFLKDVVEDVRTKYSLDERRVYLFGHSAGAEFALQMAAAESEYFAAVAIHAGSLPSSSWSIFDHASRKIPYLLIIGTRDRFFSVDSVRATRDELKARGFPVEYVEMEGHTHDYYGSANEINPKVWQFLKGFQLQADPSYKAYQEPS